MKYTLFRAGGFMSEKIKEIIYYNKNHRINKMDETSIDTDHHLYHYSSEAAVQRYS